MAENLIILGAGGVAGPSLMQLAPAYGFRPYGYRRSVQEANVGLILEPDQQTFIAAKNAISAMPIWRIAEYVPALARAGVRHVVTFGTVSRFSKERSSAKADRDDAQRFKEGERAFVAQCDAHGITWSLLRLGMLYGYRRDHNIQSAANFIRKRGFFPLFCGGQGLRQPLHANDAARAAFMALDRIHNGALTIGGETLPYRDMIGRVFECLGKKQRFIAADFALPFMRLAALAHERFALQVASAERMGLDMDYADKGWHDKLGFVPQPFLSNGPVDL